MKKIVVDTSSILFALSNRIDLFKVLSETDEVYEPVITSGVIRELTRIGSGKRKESMNARAALAIIQEHGIKTFHVRGIVDDSIISAARKLRCGVCTNDVGLKRRLKDERIKAYSIARDRRLK